MIDDDGKDRRAFQSTVTFAVQGNQTQVPLRTLFDTKEACDIAANCGAAGSGNLALQQLGSMWP